MASARGADAAEEERLRARLFGGKRGARTQVAPADESESEGELEQLEDSQLFAVDAAPDEAVDDKEGGAETGLAEDTTEPVQSAPAAIPRGERRPVWTDEDDERIQVHLAGRGARAADGSVRGTKRLRKLRANPDETSVSGTEYQLRLRKQFERMHPRPAWADTTHEAPKSAPLASSGSLAALLSTDTGLLASAPRRGPLGADRLEVERLRDANEEQLQGTSEPAAIEQVQFHPSTRSAVLLTASRDRRVRLFQINGRENPLLESLHVPDMPVRTATFHPSGESVLISGPRPYLYAYDVRSGRTLRSSPWRGAGRVVSSAGGTEADAGAERDLSFVRFEPGAASRMAAVGGRRGVVHLLDWGAGAAGQPGGQRIGELRMNAPLAGMAWAPTAAAPTLLMLSTEGRVHVWDVRQRTCPVTAYDTSVYGAKGLEVSPASSVHPTPYWSIGSSSGLVNVYGGEPAKAGATAEATTGSALEGLLAPEAAGTHNLVAARSLGNLTTAITSMHFSHDAQLLLLASRNKKDALRMVHLPTLRVFSNWPTAGTPLGHVADAAFSPGGQYLAMGNTRGRVLLYSLRHYL